ncbi:hypothetical protein [Bradyrhizobium sp. JR3.5]
MTPIKAEPIEPEISKRLFQTKRLRLNNRDEHLDPNSLAFLIKTRVGIDTALCRQWIVWIPDRSSWPRLRRVKRKSNSRFGCLSFVDMLHVAVTSLELHPVLLTPA